MTLYCQFFILTMLCFCCCQVFSFLIIWLPYAVMSIADAAGNQVTTLSGLVLKATTTMLTKACVCVNPFIYAWLNPQVTGNGHLR